MINTKRGDTLIEVTIAIGIFSMIAIAVAAVMSSGTAGSQSALETTITREEINAQAEALRFIQSSYILARSNKDATSDPDNNPYRDLWRSITSHAISGDSISTDITQYAPSTCDELYNPSPLPGDPITIFQQNAFILDIKKLSTGQGAYVYSNDPSYASIFTPTTTYPRLVFGTSNNNDSNDSLISTTVRDTLFRAEGIYIIAVKDDNSTQIVNNDRTNASDTTATAAFYDFYIRTCWYGTDATRPSTISTLIRLYDPDITPE